MIVHFNDSTYFKANRGVDRYVLENYLLPGLVRQSVIERGSKGVELPVGANQEPEYLSLEEAKAIVLDWLEQSQNLLEGDKKKLERLTNYQQFANLASNIYETRIQDPNKLLTAARLQNVADLRAANKAGSSTATTRFDPGKAIDEYNKIYLKLLSSSRQGVPQHLLQQIVAGGIPSGNGNVSEASLAAVISSNLNRLYAAGSVGTSVEAQNFAVSQELGRIISTSYPEMESMLNILGDVQIASSLREVTNRLADELKTTSSLENYEKVQVAAITATDNYLLNQTEIRAQISNAFNSTMSPIQLDNLTNAILLEIVSSARVPLTTSEIMERVSQRLNIPATQLASIQSTLESSGLSVSIEYRQNEISLKVNSRYLTPGEKNLLNKGINPFLIQNSQEKLASLESRLLKEYNEIPGHNKEFVTLREAYTHEQQSVNPKQSFLIQARAHFDQLDVYRDLSLSEKSLIRRTRFGRWVADSRSRFYQAQSKFFTKWGKIEDIITGKTLVNKIFDGWDDVTKNITIPGTNIPLFKIAPWLYDRFTEWKKTRTLQIITNYSKSTGWIGKTIHWAAKNYELGHFTTSGAVAHYASTQWGKVVKWSLIKTGMGKVLKYSARYGTVQVANAGMRTATRILLKIGGKALARLGSKAVAALIVSVTGILSVVFAIGMVLDLVSVAFEFIKEFVRNVKFRETIVGWGAAITAFVATIQLAPIALAIAAVIQVSLSFLLVGFVIVMSALFVVPQIINRNSDGFKLDSGITQVITSLLCNEAGDTTSVSPESSGPGGKVISCANCLVKYLKECYGPSTNKTTLASKGISCLVSKALNPEAVSLIDASANRFTYLQCVGFVQAAIACGGSSLEPNNACAYVGHKGANYQFVSGMSGAKPGDPIIFNSSGTCGPDGPGHIGILREDAGALVCLIDANSICSGCPSENNCLPKTRLAGYLKRII